MTRFAMLSGACALALSASALVSTPAAADEGMWTFDNLPAEKIKQDYGVTLDQKWLDNVRLSAVRLQGCSASFVSPDGLILTNNHCIVGCTAALSSAGKVDYVKAGFMSDRRGAADHHRRHRPDSGGGRRQDRRRLRQGA